MICFQDVNIRVQRMVRLSETNILAIIMRAMLSA